MSIFIAVLLAQASPVRTDAAGDPLPADAVARFGTTRLQHGGSVGSLAFSPDGRLLASASHDQSVSVWDAATGQRKLRLPLESAHCVVFASNGDLITATRIGMVQVWHLPDGKPVRQWRASRAALHALALSPNGKLLATGGDDRTVRLWQTDTGDLVRELTGHTGEVTGLCFAPDSRFIAVAAGTPRLWRITGGQPLFKSRDAVLGVAFMPDGRTLLTSGADGIIRPRNLDDYTREASLNFHKTALVGTIVTGDGKLLLTAGVDRDVRIWRIDAYRLERTLRNVLGEGCAMALSPNGKLLALATTGHRIALWDLKENRPRLELSRLPVVHELACTRDGSTLALAADDGTLRLWEPATGRGQAILGTQGGKQVLFSVGSKRLAWLTPGSTAKLVQLKNGKTLRTFALPDDAEPTALALSADDDTLAIAYREPKKERAALRLWNARGHELRTIDLPRRGALVLRFSPDGKSIAAALDRAGTALWNLDSGKRTHHWETADPPRRSLAFSPDGQVLAIGDRDGRIVLVGTGEEIREGQLTGHADEVHGVVFSPDGRLIASCGADGLVRLWDRLSGQEVLRFEGHQGDVLALDCTPDGRHIISSGIDGTVLTWDVRGLSRGVGGAVTERELDRLWEELAIDDSAKAYRAVWSLALADKQSVPALRARLAPYLGVDTGEVAKLILQLDDRRFAMREKATTELARLGVAVERMLRKARTEKPSPEVVRRIDELLRKMDRKLPAAVEWLRIARTLEVLEKAQSAPAGELLRDLAKGCPDEAVRKEAKAILGRLGLK
jgi:WD40 repeat protein